MRRIINSRLFRMLVCFCLICCFLINCSPIRAEATVVGTVVTGTAAAGVFATLFSMAMGVVFVDLTADMITGLGQHFTTFLSEHYSDDTETTNTTLTPWFEGLEYTFGGSGDDGTGNGDDDNKITLIPDTIAAGLFAWIYKIIIDGGFEPIDGEITAPSGYKYYNGHLLPKAPSGSYSCLYLFMGPNGYQYMCAARDCEYDDPYLDFNFSTNVQYWTLSEDGTSWGTGVSNSIRRLSVDEYTLIYTNSPVFYADDSSKIYFDASFPSDTYTTVITPNIYVGDIPQRIQDGSYDEDDLKLPYINHGNLFGNHTNYVDALNDVSTQLKDGSMTYDQYMDQIQTEAEGDSGTNSSPDDTTDPEVSKELSDFTLDLKDFFPFCIPFDLYAFFGCLNAAPEAPVFELALPTPFGSYSFTVDLSPYDSVAEICRKLQLLLFCIGLAFETRNLIKG